MSLDNNNITQFSLSASTAKNLSNSTISIPMMEAITPRWLLTFLPWVSVEAGVYRLNKVKRCEDIRDGSNQCREKLPELCSSHLGEHAIPQSFADYEEKPREYTLGLVQTILKVNGQIVDIFNSPINQLQQQMRITIEAMKEQQELEIINNRDFGLVNSVAPSMSTPCWAITPVYQTGIKPAGNLYRNCTKLFCRNQGVKFPLLLRVNIVKTT